jgi:hypothetical protein
MTTHITVRMAWHDSGWNGHICQNPKANVYCVGRHSFPNEVIPNERNGEWEQRHKGIAANTLGNLLPCAWSITTLLALQRPESSHLSYINASLFAFAPVPDTYLEFQRQRMHPEYIDGSITNIPMVDQLCRYHSDSQIARLLIEHDIPFDYQVPIKDDAIGIFLLPTFTVKLRGDHHYWEHIGVVEDDDTAAFWDKKFHHYELLGLEKQLVVSKENEMTDSYLEEKLRELFSQA